LWGLAEVIVILARALLVVGTWKRAPGFRNRNEIIVSRERRTRLARARGEWSNILLKMRKWGRDGGRLMESTRIMEASSISCGRFPELKHNESGSRQTGCLPRALMSKGIIWDPYFPNSGAQGLRHGLSRYLYPKIYTQVSTTRPVLDNARYFLFFRN